MTDISSFTSHIEQVKFPSITPSSTKLIERKGIEIYGSLTALRQIPLA
ncbi:MAG: hypothetical protein MGG11_13210 [Trichodesmium sp. MAG_R03]|nr:hypothetical protein [Trichodesmium sp. MAG_R03]